MSPDGARREGEPDCSHGARSTFMDLADDCSVFLVVVVNQWFVNSTRSMFCTFGLCVPRLVLQHVEHTRQQGSLLRRRWRKARRLVA